MELHPRDKSIPCCPSMHHVCAQIPANDASFSLKEVNYGHLVIRSSAKNKSLNAAIKAICNLDLPTTTLSSCENDKYLINWISPDEYLLLLPVKTEFEVEAKLRKLIQGHYAIINVTGGQTVLELSGERAQTILKKSSSYDIDITTFPIGKVVTTIFAKSQLVLRRSADNHFQLIVRRSFSDYIWKWIIDAGSRQ